MDEAHRMLAADETHKSLRYKLGELLGDTSDHMLLLTATPHKGDPLNFSLFLQLLDPDAYADVKSIREAMERRRAPFSLRRTKEAMVYFPERRPTENGPLRRSSPGAFRRPRSFRSTEQNSTSIGALHVSSSSRAPGRLPKARTRVHAPLRS